LIRDLGFCIFWVKIHAFAFVFTLGIKQKQIKIKIKSRFEILFFS